MARDRLNQLKYEIAGELVPQLRQNVQAKIPLATGAQVSTSAAVPWSVGYEDLKYEIAQELGVPLYPGYNGDLTARQAGQVGGKIGGNMVRRMIEIAETALVQQNGPIQ